MRLVSPDLIANDNKFNIHYYDYIYCFLIYGLVHLIINIVLLRANHFPFVAIGPDDFSNLNYGSPFVPVRPISYFCVFVFSKTSELGFYLLLNALIVATSSMACSSHNPPLSRNVLMPLSELIPAPVRTTIRGILDI